MIEPEDVASVKAATDIVAVITAYVQLRRVGRRFVGLCPFHGEKSPSFSVNFELGLYHCFGCQRSGDAISFVQEKEQVDFSGAVEMLAGRAGITLRYTDIAESETRRRRRRLVETMGEAVAWYHERLLTSPDAAPARRYLRSRGLSGDQVRQFQIGWAPEGWDELSKALGLHKDIATDTGLARVGSRGSLVDFFRGRVLFPIFDPQGDPVGFGGRTLPDAVPTAGGRANGPKYLNPGATKLYDKSSTLYGLNWAKTDAVHSGEVVVCEGYTDVIGFHSAGVPRAVATCGTALTEDHVKRLTRFASRVVLAFDADAAGQAAAERFFVWEQRYNLVVAVAALPAGVDPADLAQRDPEALRTAVTGAIPFMAFRLGRVWAAADLTSPEGRAKAAEQALAVVADHPNPMVIEQYLQEVAGHTRVDLELLRQRRRPAPRRPGRSPVPLPRSADGAAPIAGFVANEPPTEDGGDNAGPLAANSSSGGGGKGSYGTATEIEALKLAVEQPDMAATWFDPVLFSDGVAQEAIGALILHGTFSAALEVVSGNVQAALQSAAAGQSDATCEEVFLRLCTEAGRRELHRIRVQRLGTEDPLKFAAESGRLGNWMGTLLDDRAPQSEKLEAGTALLTWLMDQAEERMKNR